MKLIKTKNRDKLTALTVRVSAAHAERYRQARASAARHNAVFDLRGALERLIDAGLAEAQALDASGADTSGEPASAADAVEAPDA